MGTDYAVFGYLSDIFVIPECRGQGIGRRLVRAMLEHPDVAGLKVVLLRTRDAHGVHRPFGFKELPDASTKLATRLKVCLSDPGRFASLPFWPDSVYPRRVRTCR